MFRFFIFLFSFLTISFSNELNLQSKINNGENVFPTKVYNQKNNNLTDNEIFPTKVTIDNNDYILNLKEQILNKLIENKIAEKENIDFLMCFIFEIKPYVFNDQEFKSFKINKENTKIKNKIFEICSKSSKITQKNLNDFILILNNL